jgi:hypothetical protein
MSDTLNRPGTDNKKPARLGISKTSNYYDGMKDARYIVDVIFNRPLASVTIREEVARKLRLLVSNYNDIAYPVIPLPPKHSRITTKDVRKRKEDTYKKALKQYEKDLLAFPKRQAACVDKYACYIRDKIMFRHRMRNYGALIEALDIITGRDYG